MAIGCWRLAFGFQQTVIQEGYCGVATFRVGACVGLNTVSPSDEAFQLIGMHRGDRGKWLPAIGRQLHANRDSRGILCGAL